MQNNVGWNFKDEDARAEKLVPSVDVVGGDVQVLKKSVGHGIGDVAARYLHHEESDDKQWHQDGIGSGYVSDNVKRDATSDGPCVPPQASSPHGRGHRS